MPTLTRPFDRSAIRALCRKRIAAARPDIPYTLALENQVVHQILHNLASGRYERFATHRARRANLALADYADNVVYFVYHESARVRALAEHDKQTWEQINALLYRRACHMTQRLRPGMNSNADALEFAQQACLIIFTQPYPFDVAFEAWATTILNNLVLTRYTRSRDVLNRPTAPESLDAPHAQDDGAIVFLGELIADPQSLTAFESVENQTFLLTAIQQLHSPTQRDIIISAFLHGQDDAQIARRLGKTRQAIYNLRLRALARLHEILAKTQRKKQR